MTGKHLSHYLIESELGRGGMGIVYRATDTKLNRDVAIKVLPAAALASEDDRARFFREAQAAAQLSHPNIATVYQIDEAIATDGNGNEVNASDGPRPFIAMEFIEGETLRAFVARGPMKLSEAVQVAIQVADALKAAHAKDIVHRDIKSANVMLTEDGVAKVLDFGLAQTNQSTKLTRMGSTLGTVAYMSPEQARGQEVDGRTDLYSLGSMLYEIIVGSVPFAGEYEQAVVYSILNENPDPLTSRRTGVPMELERIVSKLMSKEADYRYQTAADLIADLKTVDVTRSTVHTAVSGAVSGAAPYATNAAQPLVPAAAQMSKPSLVRYVAVGVISFALGLSALVWWPSATPPKKLQRTTLEIADVIWTSYPRISNDGSKILLNAQPVTLDRHVYLFDRESNSSTALAPMGGSAMTAVFSPDESRIMYAAANAELNVLSMRDRIPQRLLKHETTIFTSAWMNRDEVAFCDTNGSCFLHHLVSGDTSPFLESRFMAETSGIPESLVGMFSIEPIPGTDSFLATISTLETGQALPQPSIAYVHEGKLTVLKENALIPQYSEDGFFAYIAVPDGNPGATEQERMMGQLMSVLFDPQTGQVSERVTPVLAAENVGMWRHAVGDDGSVWVVEVRTGRELHEPLVILDPSDGSVSQQTSDGQYDNPRLSKDGRYTLHAKYEKYSSTWEVWMRNNVAEVNTQIMKSASPAEWWPGEQDIAILRQSEIVRFNLSTKEETAVVDNAQGLFGFSPNGEWLLYSRQQGEEIELVAHAIHDSTETIITSATESFSGARFSSDGDYLVVSKPADGDEPSLFVYSFPGLVETRVLNESGKYPEWSPDDEWLYYIDGSAMKRLRVSTEKGFMVGGSPQVVKQADWLSEERFEFMPDGRIIIPRGDVNLPPDRAFVVENWGDHLRGLEN